MADPQPPPGTEWSSEREFRERIAGSLGVMRAFRAALSDAAVHRLLEAYETLKCADQSIVDDVRRTLDRRG